MQAKKTIKVETQTPQRLDVYLHQIYSNVSRTQLAKMISDQQVLVNKQVARASLKIRQNDRISLDESLLNKPIAESVDLPIIYQDQFCLVVNKPSGILTHAKGAINEEPSVASFALNYLSPELLAPDKINNRAGIVHRLDRGTSGVIIIAKTDAAYKYFTKQFSTRKVKKTYYALIAGKLSKEEAQINMPIERNPKAPSTFRTGPNGKAAVTRYQIVATNGKYSLLKLTPITGRTHQLRVHLKALNHPIVGDNIYQGEQADRLMLHATSLELKLTSSSDAVRFEAPLPESFKRYIDLNKLNLN